MSGQLEFTELERLLKRVTYKPGWRFSLHIDRFEGFVLIIEASVENSYQPGNMVDLRIVTYVPPIFSEEGFKHWILWRVQRIEVHEAREWLKFDEVPINDPHDWEI